jgi:hypothetical protein
MIFETCYFDGDLGTWQLLAPGGYLRGFDTLDVLIDYSLHYLGSEYQEAHEPTQRLRE